MRRPVAVAALATLFGATLTGCSVDQLIWGADGARVIQTTEDLIRDVAATGTSKILCAGADVELGAPSDWEGLSAGEPERFTGDHWAAQAPLDPEWSINLEGLPSGATPGSEIPGDVFYRETADGSCVIDVAWATLVSEG